MSWYGRVVWSEGMFLRPQHFQQELRYTERLIESRCRPIVPYAWGLHELRIDRELLSAGKIVVAAAAGILPDGTPFLIPEQDPPPPALDVPENTHDLIVYLALPLRREGVADIAETESLIPARHQPTELEVRDVNARDPNPVSLRISGLKLRLLTADEDRADHACIPMARIIEMGVSRHVQLDEEFIPTVTNCQCSATLKGYIDEMSRLLRNRCDGLAARVAEAGKGGHAEIADFMLLQAVNRYLPVLSHFGRHDPLHPETFYRFLLEMSGEFATFMRVDKRPESFPPYRHEDLNASFEPVIRDLRQSLSMVLDRNAIQIPLQDRKYGVRVASVFDRRLLVEASFCLVVRADMSVEELRRLFPTQVKIGPVEKIRDLVNLALPGILLRPLPVAPRQLPFRSGSVYFELDRSSEFWKHLPNSGGFAIHVSGEFPAIEMELWAIKE